MQHVLILQLAIDKYVQRSRKLHRGGEKVCKTKYINIP